MSQLYVWQPSGLSEVESLERFACHLNEQCSFYNQLLSTHCTSRFKKVGNIFVGQITSDLGINGWAPWQEQGNHGVAWAGICEDFLGLTLDEPALNRLATDLLEAPDKLTDLTGSFSACAWDTRTEQVAIVTSATQPQTLWQTDGPYGVAIGSRAGLSLDLAGRPKELDEVEASVFIAYGYLLSDGALFRHVKRIPARSHVRLLPKKPPRCTCYVQLGDYLGAPATTNLDEAAARCAEHLKMRVARQLRFSSDPVLNLTGGRDSRLIAAALSHTSSPPLASTAGDPSSLDVRVASMVAKKLGLRHISNGPSFDSEDFLSPLATRRPRFHMWSRLSEGVETLRHAMHFRDFFADTAPFPRQTNQGFNGHHAGLQKPTIKYARESPEGLNKLLGTHFKHQTAVRDRFEQMRAAIDTQLRELDAPSSRWTELYLWQTRGSQWGQDNLFVKDLFRWYWAPLFDKRLIQTGWHLPPRHQASMDFAEAITLRLRPDLKVIPYEKTLRAADRTLIKRANRRVHRTMHRFINLLFSETFIDSKTLWSTALSNPKHPPWTNLIDEQFVRAAIEGKQTTEVLWRTATIQLFSEAWITRE